MADLWPEPTYTEEEVAQIINYITDLCFGSTLSHQVVRNAIRDMAISDYIHIKNAAPGRSQAHEAARIRGDKKPEGKPMTTSDPLDDQTSINKLEAIISDHNKAMRTDMASEITGGSRSAAITNLITVKAILAWHLQKCRSYLPSKKDSVPEAADLYERAEQLGHVEGWNAYHTAITKRIEGDK